jgi:putative aminopeptidase FrvX
MKLLKRLSEAFGGSGQEAEIAAIVTEELRALCRTVRTDTLGNVVGVRPGRGASARRRRIMLAAHMDEIGFVVSHIDVNGFLRVQPAGGFDPRTLIAQRVTVLGKGKRKLTGLLNVAGKPIHVQTEEERRKELTVGHFFVDLGLPRAKVLERVEVGDRVIWDREFAVLGDCVTGKALDDRVGVYVMIEALRRVKKNRHDIYAVGTVQEEVGLRGAVTSAYEIHPDEAIALDVTLAVDTPEIEEWDRVTLLGQGVAIKIMDSASISDSGLVGELRGLAEAGRIPYQLEILPRGGTDAGGMQRARAGARAVTLSIPLRYVHSVNECAHRSDIEAAVSLLAAYLDR